MKVLQEKIDRILNDKKLTQYRLSQLIGITEQTLHQMRTGKAKFSDKVIKKLLPILEVSKEEFASWVLADKYPKEILERAIQIKKDFPYKRKSILTFNIDKILEEKQMSRTALAKQIKHSQTGLNSVIRGQVGISKSLLEKLSHALDVQQNEILSWSVADRYKADILQKAID